MNQRKDTEGTNPMKYETLSSADILVEALNRAQQNGGIFLNGEGRKSPRMIDGSRSIKGMDAIVTVAHADNIGAKTSVYTTSYKATKSGNEVESTEKGCEVTGIALDGYQSKSDPSKTISVAEYKKSGNDTEYTPVYHSYPVKLYNIDQTTLFKNDKDKYESIVLSDASLPERQKLVSSDNSISTHKEDIQLRKEINDMIGSLRENMVDIRRDDKAEAMMYDSEKNRIVIPPQYKYETYPAYVQSLLRELVSVSGNKNYLARPSATKSGNTSDDIAHEKLLIELVSAAKMIEHSLPAQISKENMSMIPVWTEKLSNDPEYINRLMKDVNKTNYLITRAEQGTKLQSRIDYLKTSSQETKKGLDDVELSSENYDIVMLMDEKEGWVCLIKAENEQPIVVKPSQEDTAMFFSQLKGVERGGREEMFRQQFAQKYYNLSKSDPTIKVDIYKTSVSSDTLSRIDSVAIFKTKDTSKLLCVATIDGDRQSARPVSQSQFQKLWYAPDMKEYKKALAAELFSDVLSQEKKLALDISLPEKYDKVALVDNDDKTYSLYVKPEGQDGFAIRPEEIDVRRYFIKAKQDTSVFEEYQHEIADKYFRKAGINPELKIDIFPSRAEKQYEDIIDNVNIFKSKDTGKIFLMPTIQGGVRLKPREITPGQYSALFASDDAKQYKINLAAKVFKGELDAKIDEKRQQSLEEKAKAEQKQAEALANQVKEKTEKVKEAKTETQVKNAVIALSPMPKQFLDLKKKHPDSLLFFRCGDFYETYQKDAEKASKIPGITLTWSSKTKDQDGKPLAMAGFPYHALDTYLPKLIRAGERVAICDQIEVPKQTLQHSSAASEETKNQEKQQQEEKSRSLGIHR